MVEDLVMEKSGARSGQIELIERLGQMQLNGSIDRIGLERSETGSSLARKIHLPTNFPLANVRTFAHIQDRNWLRAIYQDLSWH
jgi:hypothetical protein